MKRKQLARTLTLAGFFLVGACSTDTTTDPHQPVVEPDGPIAAGLPASSWGTARKPAPPPEPREIVAESGFPSRSPDLPILRENAIYRSSSTGRALAATVGHLYVVDSANGRLNVINRVSGKTTRRIFLGSMPQQVVVSRDGTAWVTLRHGHAVARITTTSDVPTLAQVGTEPMGLALSPDEERLYVVVRGDEALVALDAASLSELARISDGLDRPSTVIVNASGRIFVGGRSNQVSAFELDGLEYGVANLNALNPTPLRIANPADMAFHNPDGLVANRVMAATLDSGTGEPLFLHHITRPGNEKMLLNAVFSDGTFNPEPGGFDGTDGMDAADNTDGQTDGDGGTGESGYGQGGVESEFPHLVRPIQGTVTRVTVDNEPQGDMPVFDPLTHEPMEALLAQPSDIHHHPTLSLAFVTGFGSDNVLVLNTAPTDPMSSPIGIIRVGKAPKAIAFGPDGRLAYVLNAHDFTVSEIDITAFFDMSGEAPSFAGGPPVTVTPLRLQHNREVIIGDDPLPESARPGRRIFTYVFNDKLSRDSQFACRSCHIDGAEDGLVWMIGDGPRQTPALAGRLHDTAPFNWVGSEQELQNNMDQTIIRMGGHGLDNAELASLEEFLLTGLVAPPNPNVLPGGLTEQQERGKHLFMDPQVGCAVCHTGSGLTDGRLHDVGTISDVEAQIVDFSRQILQIDAPLPTYNTPSLRGLHATAPYLHDGSAETLHDVLARTATTMGRTDHLNESQRDDLVAYLLTL